MNLKKPFDKTRVRVGVLMGGLSAERKVSSVSGQGVLGALLEKGWNAVEIFVDRRADVAIREANIDLAFLALHGKFGEDGKIQGMLEMMGIPYTGSGVQASANAMDKLRTKQLLQRVPDMVMPKHMVYEGGGLSALSGHETMTLPVVVKPTSTGSTIGISIARTFDELELALAYGETFDTTLLVEEFVEGEEITVPILNGKALPAVRIIPKNGFFDFTAKYTKGECLYECPANIPFSAAKHAETLAVAAYNVLGCRGLARADFIVRKQDGNAVFLEINTIPGLTPTSLSPMSAAAAGMDYPTLVEQMLLTATCEDEEFPPAE